MEGFTSGNAIDDGRPRRGWFLGRFIDDDAYRQTHDVEVKWGVHPPGESNAGFAADQVARTMSVLIRGQFRLTFRRKDQTEEVVLAREGDYALWLPGVEHAWRAEGEEASVILTVRWPSLPFPQVVKE
ncbi:MAG TPA: hypothetical protein VGN57_00385 [Pirellulaceae bacterium]|jgi:hypothetical protein|nr:hypothetical protein [Pirellulaceae bacterium]